LNIMEKIRLLVIGIGPHCRRVYLPAMKELGKVFDAEIVLGIDVKQNACEISEYCLNNNFNFPIYFIDPFPPAEKLPIKLQEKLSKFVYDNKINAVIISTEPLVHAAYGRWALSEKLHILMDKPISTRTGVVENLKQAKGIMKDYDDLLEEYQKLQKVKKTIFSVNVQRRYHIGFRHVLNLINEVSGRFNAPVTSIQSMHADGQWRLPDEIITQIYHPYCQGYGKCSHSGYHIFDIASMFYKAGIRPGKVPNKAEVYSSFVDPRGFIKQFNQDDYRKYFGNDYIIKNNWTDNKLDKMYKGFGELDSFSTIRLLKDNDNICNISINLMHNSFARRTWLQPGVDLYKGNGRVKHEYHNIQQGPFQCIQIHSYQVNDKHDINTDQDLDWGGNNHFDIYVYRNAGMFGRTEKPIQLYRISDLDYDKLYSLNKLASETAKQIVLKEFLSYIRKIIKKTELISSIEDHWWGVKFMSSVYVSHIMSQQNKTPIVRFNLNHV